MTWLEKNGIKCVCFDIDGTLYDISFLNRVLFKSALSSPFFSIRYMMMRKKMRAEDGKMVLDAMDSLSFRKREMALAYPSKDEEWLPVFLEKEKKMHSSWDREYRKVRPFDNLERVFSLIRKSGIRIGVLSDFPLSEKLAHLGIESYVDFAISAEDIGRLKPCGTCFLEIVKKASLDPSQILYVGDSEKKDVKGAKSFNMHAALISRSANESMADIVAKDYYEMEKILFSEV